MPRKGLHPTGTRSELNSLATKLCLSAAMAVALGSCSSPVDEPVQPSIAEQPSQATQAPIATPLQAITAEAEPSLPEGEPPGEVEMTFEITSEAFQAEATIPTRHTCDGEDLSPPLTWSDPPPGTQSFALIMDDPDAPVGTWVHWVLFNLPAGARELSEAIPAEDTLADGSRHGMNSWRRVGYGGPCPPSGTHRYFFKLYALDMALELSSDATKEQVLEAMQGHVLSESSLMGTYARP